MRIEVNRKVFNIEAERVTGRYLRGIVGVGEHEDLYGKGDPGPGEKGKPGSGWLVEPDREYRLNRCAEYFTVERPVFVAGFSISLDPELPENQIKMTVGGMERIFEFDGEDLNEITI